MGTQVNRQTVFEIKKGFKLKFIFKGKFERNLRVTSLGVRTFRINLSISWDMCPKYGGKHKIHPWEQ